MVLILHIYEDWDLVGLILPPSEMTCLKENLKLINSIRQDELKFEKKTLPQKCLK